MNMNPDEATLALWLDDELTGDDLAAVEAWALARPEQIAAREEIRLWRTTMSTALPGSEEPPYADFFNQRVLQGIRETTVKPEHVVRKSLGWKSWFAPLTACAGMALAFWIGTRTRSFPEVDVTGAPKAILIEPVVYTPESGVMAEWFTSTKASATVIVLNGVTAIPDSTDFSATALRPVVSETDHTAGIQSNPQPRQDNDRSW